MSDNKLAAVDIGTNSFHLIVAELLSDGNFKIIDTEKEVIRLGEGSKGDIKFIQKNAIDRGVETLKNFKGIANSHDADISAVATSAVREAKNKNEFISEVKEKLGIEIDVVSGNEEARLIYLGIIKAVPVFNERVLCIDIGGGSTEFVIGEKGKILYSVSLKLGAFRLSQRFFSDSKTSKINISECKKWTEGVLFKIVKEIQEIGFAKCVGSSGTIMSAKQMSLANLSKNGASLTLNNSELHLKQFNDIYKLVVSKKTTEARKAIPGLDAKRADIIPAGLILLKSIYKLLDLQSITISDYALREGIIVDSISKRNQELFKHTEDIRLESVKQLANNSNYDREHCTHTSKLSLRMFDDLLPLHKLTDICRGYLDAAARLHDIGFQIAHSQHHRHSNYIIRNSNLMGYTEKELLIISNIARYHRKSHPKPSHPDFMKLSKGDREIVKRLAAILRIADSFDRTHRKLVKDIHCSIGENAIEIELDCDGEFPEIEYWSFGRRKTLFKEVFGKDIDVINKI